MIRTGWVPTFRTLAVVSLLGGFALHAPRASAQDACSFQEIDPLDGLAVRVSALNDWGQVVGRVDYDGPPYYRAFVWQHGVTRMLPLLAGGGASEARAINERGEIVGSMIVDGQTVPVLWTHDRVQRLPGGSQAIDVNNRGEILGQGQLGGCLLWRDPHREPIDLGTLGGDGCVANAINDLGQIVGTVGTGPLASTGFIWSKGVFTPIAPPSTAPAGATVALMELNNAGVAVGRVIWERHADEVVWTRESGLRPLSLRSSTLNDWGTLAASDEASPLSRVVLSDRFGHATHLGSVGGTTDTIQLNNLYQIAFSGYTNGGYLARFCQLR